MYPTDEFDETNRLCLIGFVGVSVYGLLGLSESLYHPGT